MQNAAKGSGEDRIKGKTYIILYNAVLDAELPRWDAYLAQRVAAKGWDVPGSSKRWFNGSRAPTEAEDICVPHVCRFVAGMGQFKPRLEIWDAGTPMTN